MKKTRTLRRLAEGYFVEENKPYSMQELCAVLDVSFATLCAWENGSDGELSSFARTVKARVAATWEKGELSAGLCSYLHKAYLVGEEQGGEQPLDITIRIADDGA